MVILRTEAMAFLPTSSSASPSDSSFLITATPSSLALSPGSPPKKDMSTNGSRMLSKQGWEELKPTIRQLYLEQNRTLKQLAEYIREHYGVKPTKKQLTHRISGWGFEKNVKREERRAIIQNLSPEMRTPNFEAKSIRGRTLDKAKLERWMKQEGVLVEAAINEQDELFGTLVLSNCQMKTLVEKALDANLVSKQDQPLCIIEEDPIVQQGCGDIQFDWKEVDIVGSPGFGRLIGALTVESSDDIPFLDLATGTNLEEDPCSEDVLNLCYEIDVFGSGAIEYSNGSTDNLFFRRPQDASRIWLPISPDSIVQCRTNSNTSWIFRLDFPQRELYPFPQRGSDTWVPPQQYNFPSSSAPWTEPECIARFRRLRSIGVKDSTKLVASMAQIAYQYQSLSQFGNAEKWYRYTVTAAGKMPEAQPCWILNACLELINCIQLQGRHAEARDLQQDLHIKLQRLLGPHHSLTRSSMQGVLNWLRWFGKQREEEAASRELLQSQLNLLGPRHKDSIIAIIMLGQLLQRQNKLLESEHLLTIAIDLQTKHKVIHDEPYADISTSDDEQSIFLVMLTLAHTLNMSGKHNRSRDLLREGKNRFQRILQLKGRMFFNYQNEVARTQRFAGCLDESERILRDLLEHHEISMTPNRRTNILRELGEILTESGRLNEAGCWFGKEFLVLLDNVGIENPLTKASCRRLGFCYAKMGRYDEAMLHFKRMIGRLDLEDPQSIHDRQEYIREIESWMEEADEMRLENLAMHLWEFEDSVSDDTPTKCSTEERSITLETPGKVNQLEYAALSSS